MPEVKLVPLSQIPYEECFAFQCRNAMSQEHVEQLLDLVSESDEEQQLNGRPLRNDLFPPLTVFTRGALTAPYFLADGFHRYEALTQAHRDAWLCEVHVVSDPLFSAKEFSLKANTTHGLRRDSETCRRVFMRAREMFPDLKMYGDDGIEGKTRLSRGFLHAHLKRLKDEGNPDQHEVIPLPPGARTKKSTGRPSASKRVEAKVHPPDEPAVTIDQEGNPRPQRARTTDKLGRQIPPGLLEKANSSQVTIWIREFGMLVNRLDSLAGQPGWEYLDAAAMGRDLRTMQRKFRAAEYYTECPRCDVHTKCKLCKGAGFITAQQYSQLSDLDKQKLQD